MRTTDIKYWVGLKKSGKDVIFLDCPQCRRFFGTDKTGIETCSIECDAEYSLRNLQNQAGIRNRINIITLSKPYI